MSSSRIQLGVCLAALAVSVTAFAAPSSEPDSKLLDSHKGTTVDTTRTTVFNQSWRKNIIRTGMERAVTSCFGRPAISERAELLVVGTTEGKVLGMDMRHGNVKWTFAHIAPFETAAVVVDVAPAGQHHELALLGSRDGKLFAFEVTTGEVAWEIALDGDMRAPPKEVGRELLVSTSTNKVFVIDPVNGAIRWVRGRPAPTGLTIQGHARAMAYDGIVYAAFSDGYAEAYALDDGRGMWSRPLSLHGGDFVDSDADPVIAEGRLFVASYSDGIYALDPRDGTTFWMRAAPAVTSLGVHGSTVIAASADGWIWGLAPIDGELEYRTRLPLGAVSRMIVVGDVGMMTAGEGLFLVFDATNGKPLQATVIGGLAASEPVLAGKNLAVVSSLGYVVVMHRAGTRRFLL